MRVRFAGKRCDMEKIYERICAIFIAGYGCGRKAEELADLYERTGSASVALDNMLYDRLGLSCEDLIEMLRKEEVVLS